MKTCISTCVYLVLTVRKISKSITLYLVEHILVGDFKQKLGDFTFLVGDAQTFLTF